MATRETLTVLRLRATQRNAGVCNGHHLRQQLMDVIIRVRAVRPYGVKMMVELLRDADMFSQSSRDPTAAEVMCAPQPRLQMTCCPQHVSPLLFGVSVQSFDVGVLRETWSLACVRDMAGVHGEANGCWASMLQTARLQRERERC